MISTVLLGSMFMLGSCEVKEDNIQQSEQEQKQVEQEDKNQTPIDKLLDLEGYRANTKVTYSQSDGTKTEYILQQTAKISGEYKLAVTEPKDIAGSTTIFDGQKIIQYNKNITDEVITLESESPERVELLLTSFIHNYKNSDEVTVLVSSIENENNVTTIEAKIGGNHKVLHSEILTLDNETFDPIQLVILTEGGEELIKIEYLDYQYNPDITADEFYVEEIKN